MESKNLWIMVLLFVLLVLWTKYTSLSEENAGLQDTIAEYEDALVQANQNIEEVNSMIEDAQSNAWSTYEDMGSALDNLYTVDTVLAPFSKNPFLR